MTNVFEVVVRAVPRELREKAADVVIRVEEFCDEETEAEMGLESPFEGGVGQSASLRPENQECGATGPRVFRPGLPGI